MSANADVARVLRELATLTTIDEGSPQAFRARAYEAAAQAVRDQGSDVAELSQAELVAIKGIGKSTAEKIRTYLDTGTFPKLEELRARYPAEFVALTKIPGLGPKTLIALRDRLGVKNLEDLRRALDAEAVRGLPGMGAKSEEKMRHAIERLGMTGKERRTPMAIALPLAGDVVARLRELPGVRRAEYAGSLRRFRETIGDVDVVVATTDPAPVMAAFVSMPMVAEVIGRGETKSSILTRDGLQVDLRVVAPAEFGAALLYFTGSKAHNIALRQRALERGWTLNEYALAELETEKVVAARTEKAIYAALDLPYIEPTLREDTGEVEAAAAGALPALVQERHLKGDLHVHTDLSGDGRAPLRAMLDGAAARSLAYVAITDHGENLTINGVGRDDMLRQRRQLAKLQDAYPDMRLLHGCELNIAPDGTVDYDPEFLAGFDWCVASVHSSFDLDPATQTKRVVTAMEHPAVAAIGHLTGRMLGRRPGIELDTDGVIEAAARTGTALEINGALARLDAPVDVIRAGREAGVVFVIDTDAHHPDEYRRAHSGVLHAQRAWLERKHVANAWTERRFLKWLEATRG